MFTFGENNNSSSNTWINLKKKQNKQECIPVGCVLAARRPYAGVCFPGGDVCSRGVSAPRVGVGGVWSRGAQPAPGGGGVWSQGVVWSLGGVAGPMGGLVLGGVCSWGGVCSGGVSQHALRQTPLPPVDRLTPVKILPWPNFVAPGNKLRIWQKKPKNPPKIKKQPNIRECRISLQWLVSLDLTYV